MERENNIFIETWKKTIEAILNANILLYAMSNKKFNESNEIRELASKQLKLLDETKPNKDKSLYSQANEKQKEFIDYLEKVILYGNLEGQDNVNIRNHTI